MRQILGILILFLVTIIYTGCQKETFESSENSNLNNTIQNKSNQPVLFQPDQDEMDDLMTKHQAWLQKRDDQPTRDCMQTVFVPDDYPTIQEAVDAVCEDGNVMVRAGTYDEIIFVFTPGIQIKALGDVTVNGVIQVLFADNVKIHNFNINAPASSAIAFVELEGGEAKNNNVSGSALIGILVWRSYDVLVKHNDISGAQWGILCGTYPGDGFTSGNNTILNNTVTGITLASCIGLQAETDHNVIMGNVVNSNPSIYNAAIMVNSDPGGESCDHNIIKNNQANNNSNNGIWVDDGGHYNTIGPNNSANSNAETGILLDELSSNNHVFNNTALDNTVCDIVDEGGTDNTYKKNTAECTDGL